MAADEEFNEEVVRDTLDGIEGEFRDKVAAIAAYDASLRSEAKSIQEAEAKMAKRRKQKERQADSMTRYLCDSMVYTGISKVETPELLIKTAKTPGRVVILDVEQIPQQYKYVHTEERVDKSAMRDMLKAGTDEIPGVQFVKGHRLSIK